MRIFSVVGSALNFGGRRMETIARVAWLPVALLLVVNMATVFAYLSIIAGRPITFSDVPSYIAAQQILGQHIARGWEQNENAMWLVSGINFALQTILIASFMAPLVRFAGLDERPRPGALRLAFGPDQLRYIFASFFSLIINVVVVYLPILIASFYSLKYIFDALAKTVATFPDPESLHTIKLQTGADIVAASGMGWIYELAIPVAAAAPFALIAWLVMFFHFHPRNRPAAPPSGNAIARGLVTFVLTGAMIGGLWLLFRGVIKAMIENFISLGGASLQGMPGGPLNAILVLGIVAYLLVSYVNLRLYAYPGVAVCRKSLAPGGLLRVSRGWNIVRLQIIIMIISLFLVVIQVVINAYALTWILQTLGVLYQAVASSTRLINSGVTPDWVQPVFVWTWNAIKILTNVIWTFFSYGVAAGLFGRLYRESEA